jgi:hypothetical protein
MYVLSLGVSRIGDTLPLPVYGLLSGLNAATVGIIALAAVQLASKAITDSLTRILVIGGACAGLCYTALWYFPVLMIIAATIAVVWDVWLSRVLGKLRARVRRRRRPREPEAEPGIQVENISMDHVRPGSSSIQLRRPRPVAEDTKTAENERPAQVHPRRAEETSSSPHEVSIRSGVIIICAFFGKAQL